MLKRYNWANITIQFDILFPQGLLNFLAYANNDIVKTFEGVVSTNYRSMNISREFKKRTLSILILRSWGTPPFKPPATVIETCICGNGVPGFLKRSTNDVFFPA